MPKLTYLVFSDGERFPALIDDDGMPDFWATLFVTITLRHLVTASAIENILGSILHLRLWEQIERRDIIAELSQGQFLSDEDIFSLRSHCLLDVRSLRKWMAVKTSKHIAKISHVQPSASKTLDHVSKGHAANRIAHISHFLHFTARTMLRRRGNFAQLKALADNAKLRLLAAKHKMVKKAYRGNDPDFRAPPPTAFEKMMAIVKPDSPDNPYKDKNIRIRNDLMFQLMYQTGIRAGELLSLHIGDIDYQKGKVTVVRRHDDLIDPRSKQPVAKTLGRTLPIELSLARGLYDYIMKIRSGIKGSNKHPFIFVTHKAGKFCGRPISDTTFRNRIVKHATQMFPEILDEINRHGFRHNFNYGISKRIDAWNEAAKSDPKIEPINEKREMQIRKQLNGWSSDATAEIYNKRHIKEMADQLMQIDMQDQAKHIKKGNKF